MKARYLTFFSYIGTKFRSSEKIWLKEGRNYPDPESVQGMMEIALLRLKPLKYPNLVLSSRTDGGVHALNSSAHFDLIRGGDKIFEPHYITYEMNRFFFKGEISIFVRNCLRVNDNFNARFNAISRTYLYRLAVIKPDIPLEQSGNGLVSLIPIEEWKRCHFLRLKDFNIERFKEGAKHFVGYHDFTTFKQFDKLNQHKQNRREIKSFEVRPGKACVTSHSAGRENNFNYWDIEIVGRGFVHNQIRRMIGTLISVAVGKLEPQEIKVMLQVPSKHSWYTFIQNCPPDGLYLSNVRYNPEDLLYNPDVTVSDSELQRDSEDYFAKIHSKYEDLYGVSWIVRSPYKGEKHRPQPKYAKPMYLTIMRLARYYNPEEYTSHRKVRMHASMYSNQDIQVGRTSAKRIAPKPKHLEKLLTLQTSFVKLYHTSKILKLKAAVKVICCKC